MVFESFEEIFNRYVTLWDSWGCPMNGVDRAQIRLLLKRGDVDTAMDMMDRYQEKISKTHGIPLPRKLKIDARLSKTQQRPILDREWEDESRVASQWNSEGNKEWLEYQGESFAEEEEDGW